MFTRFSLYPADDYRKWPAQHTDKIVRDAAYQPPTQPFEGASNYTTDYPKHHQAPRPSLRPAPAAKTSDEPFSGETGYRAEYVRHPLPPREARDKPQWAPSKAQLDALSNYMKDFVAKSVPLVASCKPQAGAYKCDVPFEGDTTQRIDYKRWATERPPQREAPGYVRPAGEVDYNTTTNCDYNRKPIDVRAPFRPGGRKGEPGKFDGATNYRKDFRRWSLGARTQPIDRGGRYAAPEVPFEGTSNYHDNYVGHQQPVRSSMKPMEGAGGSKEPFDAKTGYRDDYIRHKLSAKPPREAAKWQPNAAKLDDLSNYRKDYTLKETGKQASCKPDPRPVQSEAPFEGGTTQRTDYQRWPTERPAQHEGPAYVKPDGAMDMATTSGVAYTKKPIVMVSAKRPCPMKGQPGKFDGTTNYAEDFRRWSLGERPLVTMRPQYVAPQAPFEGTSRYTNDYVRHQQAPRSSMRPADGAGGSDAPFVGHTEYRQEYIKKASSPCPAAVLDTHRARYVFADQDRTGHKWYRPASGATIADLPKSRGLQNAAIGKQLTALSVA